jgi:hypothetical protein
MMSLDLVKQPEFIKSQIERLRATLLAEPVGNEIAESLGIDIRSLNKSQRDMLENALSEVQVESKLWLLSCFFDCFPNESLNILVLGGWCGVLPWLAKLIGCGRTSLWTSIDIDPEACLIGEAVFGRTVSNLKFLQQDIYELDYQRLALQPNLVVINTICEHLSKFSEWRSMLPKDTVTILQSNNFKGCCDHVNCVDSIDEMVTQAALQEILYKGELEMSLFTRYMVIGLA